jgi:excisionase family DNA binding protein
VPLNDAAAEAGVHPITIRRMIASGELPAYRVGRRGVFRIDRRDIDEVLITRVKPSEVRP